ncbi:MAG: ABC transporter ATP-binding protein [Cryobacterium sp.]|nr:ABC transporter ATP-binding protein [Cryobacterium sp.]
MSMDGGRGRGRIGSPDAKAQKLANQAAPKIDGLFRRIAQLFELHKTALIFTGILVILGATLSVIPPLLTQKAFDLGLFPKGGPNMPVLIEIVTLMVAIYVASGAVSVIRTRLTATVGNKVMSNLRVKLFRHLQSMEFAFFTRTRTGVIQSRLQNDVGGVAGVLTNTVSSVLGNTVSVAAALIAMLLLSWQLTVVAVILMPLLVIVQRRVGQVRARIATKTQESLSELTAITQESLSVSGILLAKSFNQQDSEIRRYERENQNQVGLQVKLQMSGQWFFALVQIFLAVIPAIIYITAAWLIEHEVPVTAGTIVAFTTVQARLMSPMMGLLRLALDLQTSGALFARIFEYLDLKPAISDLPGAKQLSTQAPLGLVEFENVDFHYPDQVTNLAPILRDVSFTIKPGEFAAFVGPSGAGKTTIAYLIPRLHDATAGVVRFAGEDVKSLKLDSLQANIGIVSQETYLFHSTILENLKYAKPGATQSEIEHACRAANIHDAILKFPEGYETVVGERGYRLSGGEKQRIAIARVLLKDPPVLILDEATSALDSISERSVQNALDEASKGRTTIAIAHRLSTIISADVIFVIENGQIRESGTHEELLSRRGAYFELYNEQLNSPK